MAYSPDGQLLLTGGDAVVLWHVASGRQLLRLQGRGPVRAVDFSPDGQRLLTAGADSCARVWDARSGRVWLRLESDEALYAAVFSPDGRQVLTAGLGGRIRLWDSLTGEQIRTYEVTVGDIVFGSAKMLAFLPDGRHFVSDWSYRGAVLWEVETGRQVRTFGDTAVDALALSTDGERLVTAHEDGTAKIWDVHSGEEVARITVQAHGFPQPVQAVAFAPGGADTYRDVAVLAFVDRPAPELATIEIHADDDLRIGSPVFAIGNPLGRFPYSVSSGVIGGLNRSLHGFTGGDGYLQTDAAIIWGNSGGPLIDARGRVVGLNTRIHLINREPYAFAGPQLNFALEGRHMARIVDDLIATGRFQRAYLGGIFEEQRRRRGDRGPDEDELFFDLSLDTMRRSRPQLQAPSLFVFTRERPPVVLGRATAPGQPK